ncbi:hypothetical protein [Streptomyces stackebrandtii]|uniref:hypothetical protein n=1 Tax=Streptomyces stackebrandtii TaxID=3051177 RepID=UPI0028DBB078|nr:hypothetical protein [Streptomyces sp. DSM 40976]
MWETLLIAVVTAVVSAVVAGVATGVLVVPRMEARKRRIGEVHLARDRFLASMLKIMSASARMRAMNEPAAGDPDCTDVVRDRIRTERARWMKQMDEATEWMVDNIETYSLSWPAAVLREMVGTYAAYARAVVISERTDDRKAKHLARLTEPVWEVFGSRAWQRGPRLLPRSIQKLAEAVDALGEDGPHSDASDARSSVAANR